MKANGYQWGGGVWTFVERLSSPVVGISLSVLFSFFGGGSPEKKDTEVVC